MSADPGTQNTSPPAESSPDDHRKFSLGEDWAATIVGLVIFTLCLVGALTPEMIP